MFMLVYPFTFFAVNGVFRLLRESKSLRDNMDRSGRRRVLGVLCVTVVLGCVYLATPVLMNTVQVGVFALPRVNLHFSSAPTVPYQDVEGVIEAWSWLDGRMGSNSCVLVNHAFVSWQKLYLDKSHVSIEFWKDADSALDQALDLGFGSVYLVWWNTNIGWYDVSVPNSFTRLSDFGRISVYECEFNG